MSPKFSNTLQTKIIKAMDQSIQRTNRLVKIHLTRPLEETGVGREAKINSSEKSQTAFTSSMSTATKTNPTVPEVHHHLFEEKIESTRTNLRKRLSRKFSTRILKLHPKLRTQQKNLMISPTSLLAARAAWVVTGWENV